MAQEQDATPTGDCSSCPHRNDRLTTGRCVPGDICVKAMSGRQIARFFSANPDLAELYSGDDFWERRAIAARYLSQQKLLQMLGDPDEVVRRVLAYRLPEDELGALIADPDREVRITVADRLPVDQLEQLVTDEDYLVRQYVAKRLKAGRLFRMIRDPEREVRKTVAARLPLETLPPVARDPESEVRREVAVIQPPEWNRFAHGFTHIFAGGYAAGYYSYKWAEVLSADAFSLFEERGIFDQATGQSFLENILERGGSADAMELFVAFRGREPSVDPLLRHSGIAA